MRKSEHEFEGLLFEITARMVVHVVNEEVERAEVGRDQRFVHEGLHVHVRLVE